ncbi:hypothetical protein L873DRAFT_1899767 [Choiromyces venosus 120613-1]|uniref:Uncharacterized protein n=1 Tax=Choiromyces venosus 120613-1 TaxID=1336337 RepID=A0A3N4JQD6_9PEZI|nr:hypothetical protein L873DRAFT_1899767 [Choiromyces venosus 120613-1]
MQDLYDELWGKELRVIEDRPCSIPWPQHGFRPGYKVDLKEIGDEAFPDPEFAKGKKEQVFKVLRARSELPCGTNRLLVCQEFETIERKLLKVESDKWTDINPKLAIPVGDLNLDYKVAGQPDSVVDSHGSVTDANSLFDLPKDQKWALWILMDEELKDASWNRKVHGWFMALAASPAKIRGSR